jgi:hypothetical protein
LATLLSELGRLHLQAAFFCGISAARGSHAYARLTQPPPRKVLAWPIERDATAGGNKKCPAVKDGAVSIGVDAWEA